MNECGKATMRRLHDPAFMRQYFVGDGIDIGSGSDALYKYAQLFPLMRSCTPWDLAEGDAQFMKGASDESYDFVHSSHCLEHVVDVKTALANWLRILKPGGYLVVLVPDEDMYEQGVWPSSFNSDHKHTFTLWKRMSWSPVSINLMDLLRIDSPAHYYSLQLIRRLTATHRETRGRIDQTLSPVGECAIEFVIRKEIAA